MGDFMHFPPSPSHRFLVNFLFSAEGLGLQLPASKNPLTGRALGAIGRLPVPSVLDVGFQRVSGLSRSLNVTAYSEGGENLRNRYFADKVQHGSLVLERGVMPVTPLSTLFNAQFMSGHMMYVDAIVTLLDFHTTRIPLCNWLISNALPVRWDSGDLDADSNRVLINKLELRYQEMIPMGVRQ